MNDETTAPNTSCPVFARKGHDCGCSDLMARLRERAAELGAEAREAVARGDDFSLGGTFRPRDSDTLAALARSMGGEPSRVDWGPVRRAYLAE